MFCLQAQAELGFEGRLSLEGSLVVLDQVRAADVGQFKIIDILGFTVSRIHLELQRKRWPPCWESGAAASLFPVCCSKLLQFKHANERSSELFMILVFLGFFPPHLA